VSDHSSQSLISAKSVRAGLVFIAAISKMLLANQGGVIPNPG